MGASGGVRVGRSICPGEDEGDAGPFAAPGVVLGYRDGWSAPGISCSSAFAGLTCRNSGGHGFFLSRDRWKSV
jgi:hypothetical protein